MDQSPQPPVDQPAVKPPFLSVFLQAMGFVNLVVAPVGALIVLGWRLREHQPLDVPFLSTLVTGLVVGITMGGLLVAAAAVLRYVHAMAHMAETSLQAAIKAAQEPNILAEDQPAGTTTSDSEQTVALLTDLRDFQLLAPDDREKAKERLHNRVQRRAAEEIVDAINSRQLGRARLLLQDAEAAFGSTPTLARLQTKIDEAAARNEALDFARTKRQVEEASQKGQWAIAEQFTQKLYANHPSSARARQLWQRTRCARLYAHIQKCADQHRWSEAAAATEEFLERFPAAREADALRRQMETLRSNAEIVQRKEIEARFKDLVRDHEYADALRLAKHVVEQYPDSPQARALKDQIPILEKRVAG